MSLRERSSRLCKCCLCERQHNFVKLISSSGHFRAYTPTNRLYTVVCRSGHPYRQLACTNESLLPKNFDFVVCSVFAIRVEKLCPKAASCPV